MKYPDKENITNMDAHFQFFLHRMGIKKEGLSDEQYTLIESAFYAGASSVMLASLFVDEEELDSFSEKILSQLENFWAVENLKDAFNID